ncbi:hypothetical protein P7G97_04320 [Enterococcus canintestini]|nr:hypothetical protein [Enterococcus canintestini]
MNTKKNAPQLATAEAAKIAKSTTAINIPIAITISVAFFIFNFRALIFERAAFIFLNLFEPFCNRLAL